MGATMGPTATRRDNTKRRGLLEKKKLWASRAHMRTRSRHKRASAPKATPPHLKKKERPCREGCDVRAHKKKAVDRTRAEATAHKIKSALDKGKQLGKNLKTKGGKKRRQNLKSGLGWCGVETHRFSPAFCVSAYSSFSGQRHADAVRHDERSRSRYDFSVFLYFFLYFFMEFEQTY